MNYFSACFGEGLAFNTVKTRVSAITYYHKVFDRSRSGLQSLSAHPDVPAFFQGVHRKFPPVIDCVPAWDLPTVLDALKCSPFEPLDQLDLKLLTFKTAFLMAIVSTQRLGEIHAFDITPQFSIITPQKVVFENQC